MVSRDYYSDILEMLEGTTPELQEIPSERLDWSGISAVLELYDSTAGEDRDAIIGAFGKVIEDASTSSRIRAQVLLIVTSLELTQLETSIHGIRDKDFASEDLVQSAITNYEVSRTLRSRSA